MIERCACTVRRARGGEPGARRRSSQRTIACAALAAWISTACFGARAASIEALTVTSAAGRYTLRMRAHLDAAASATYAVLADPRNLTAINEDMLQTSVVGHPAPDAIDVYTVFHACVLWICRSIRTTQRLTLAPSSTGGEVSDAFLPGGDFRSGRVHWSIRQARAGAELEASAELEPAFPIPAVVGPWLLRRWLRDESVRSLANLERLAQARIKASAARIRTSADRTAR